MSPFIDKNFLLYSEAAQELYRRYAAPLPIIDYHCHLDPKMVAQDHKFSSITELWLGGDHYKWRAMRSNGIAERYCTGEATDWEKFEQWAATMPYLLRNPLYHWSHLELARAFDIHKVLTPQTAREIFEECNEKLKLPEYSARALMRRFHVEVVCTTDDPADSLEWHALTRESGFEIKMLPAWRPDRAMAIENPATYKNYIERLSAACGREISTYATLLEGLHARHDFFASQGCRLSDHGTEEFYAEEYTEGEIAAIFDRVMRGITPTPHEVSKFKSAMLYEGGLMDAEAGWTQQFHYGALRNNNSRMMEALGPDTGFDSMGEFATAQALSRFLDRLNSAGKLAKTILYNLNPAANEMLGTMIGNFQDDSVPGKMQMGAAWWFCDNKEGMERQMNALSNLGLLSRFVGMLTDSRSFLSYPRHEYFRRILCNLLSRDLEEGLIPYSMLPRVEQMVEDICYYNAKHYFGF